MSETQFYEHPLYAERQFSWAGLKALYDGEHRVLTDPRFLWLHELECGEDKAAGEKLRRIRCFRSRYLNLMEPVVSRWQSFLFRKPANIPPRIENDVFGPREFANVNGRRMGFRTFIRERIGRDYLIYGKPIVFVDTSDVEAITIADAKAKGLRPYMDTICPLDFKDWRNLENPPLDVEGQFDFARFEYAAMSQRGPTDKPELVTYAKIPRLIDGRYVIEIYKSKKGDATQASSWELVGRKPIAGWGEVPIATIESESFIKDAAEMQLLVFNFMSAESSIVNNQAFRNIFIIGLESEKHKVAVGEYVWQFLNQGATVESIEPVDATTISKAVDRAIDFTFKVAFNQVMALAAGSKESPSAETRRAMMDDFVAIVETSLTEIEDVVNQAVYFYAKFKGIKLGESDRITFDKKVTERDFDQFLATWNSLRDDFRKIAEVRKEVLKKGAESMGLSEESLDAIEKFDFEAEQKAAEQQRTAMLKQITDGNTGTGGAQGANPSDRSADTSVREPAGHISPGEAQQNTQTT